MVEILPLLGEGLGGGCTEETSSRSFAGLHGYLTNYVRFVNDLNPQTVLEPLFKKKLNS
jgi:hypothetical protein